MNALTASGKKIACAKNVPRLPTTRPAVIRADTYSRSPMELCMEDGNSGQQKNLVDL